MDFTNNLNLNININKLKKLKRNSLIYLFFTLPKFFIIKQIIRIKLKKLQIAFKHSNKINIRGNCCNTNGCKTKRKRMEQKSNRDW